MANPWFPFYVDDYERKTSHLTLLERGAYSELIRRYYMLGGPLPANALQVHRMCRATEQQEREAIDYCLDYYFRLDAEGYHHDRCDEEIVKSRQISEKRAKSANSRHSKCNANAPANAQQVQTQLQPQPHITTTPIPPEAAGIGLVTAKPKRRKFDFSGYKSGVTEVVNYLNGKWPEVRPGDKSPIRFNNAAFADRVDALLQQGFSVEQLKSIGDKYLAEPNDWPSCPHFFFGPGKPNGSGANNYLAYAKMLIHEQSKVVTH